MESVKQIFKDFLENAGKLELIKLGSEETSRAPKAGKIENVKFTDRLKTKRTANNSIIILAVTMLFIVFLLGVFFAFYYRDKMNVMGGAFAVLLLLLTGIIRQLRSLWLEKTLMDVSIALMDDLPPEEGLKFIQVVYRKHLKHLGSREK